MEQWKRIGSWPYDASDYGQIRSHTRRILDSQGRLQTKRGRLLVLSEHKETGHLYAYLYVNNRQIARHVGRLVLEAFVGPCPQGMECCHNDGDPANNRLENLRWDTRHSNVRDRVNAGSGYKLTPEDVQTIRQLLTAGHPRSDVARQFNVTYATIYGIATNRSWRHIK